MKTLRRKLLRDIGNMRGAVFTISLVVAVAIVRSETAESGLPSAVSARSRSTIRRATG